MNYTIAFVGNPNVGKSAWINALSGANFKVGNWPGVTVEKKEAFVHWGEDDFHLIDLPGTHSLENSQNEENITATFLKNEHVDLLVNVLDASNLASNFLLSLCLRELQLPMIMIFNFMDEVEKYHIWMDVQALSRRLQIAIYPFSALDQKHHHTVKEAILQHVGKPVKYHPLLSPKDELAFVHIYNELEKTLDSSYAVSNEMLYQLVWGFLRHEEKVEYQFLAWHMNMGKLDGYRQGINEETLQAGQYQMIASLMHHVHQDSRVRYARTQKIDRILLHKVWGFPLFLLIFTMVLFFVFRFSAPFNQLIAYLINDVFTRYLAYVLSWAPEVLQRLLLDGVVAGVGGILVFIPIMTFLYFMLSLLEESGYMSRISFLLDRFMRVFHLSGKSFVALLLGFGCNVPAIYATRTLDNEKQKRLTAMLIPFMSCGARLPVYVLFASAFFVGRADLMILSVYGIGIFMALLFALVFSRFAFLKDEAMYMQELPPYRMPNFRVVVHKVKEEVKGYVHKATGIVLWAMILLWGLSYFPNGQIENSYIAQASRFVQPFFEPLGFANRWESIASLPGGIIAKETIVGYFEQVLGNEERTEKEIDVKEDGKAIINHSIKTVKDALLSFISLSFDIAPETDSHIQQLWDDPLAKLRAFSFMVYVLLSIPCVMTLQAMYHEYGWKLMALSMLTMTLIPYIVSACIFQVFSHIL